MRITGLGVYKGTTFEVELDYDRKIYLHADIIADFGLTAGMELDRVQLRKIIYASNFRRAYQRALYLLDYKDYTSHQMREKLIGTYKNEALCDAVIEKLEEHRIIDDERYAERAARRLVEVKRFGYYRARRELMQKGIDRETAENALEPYESCYGESLAYLLEKKYSSQLTDEDDRKSIERVKASLARYGYGFDEIKNAVREYFDRLDEEDSDDE
ncbi:MAG: RecX family transcriptional regulator [Ruminococcus sp.]|nr:RecX family transcriptional regulator [Ruminococcus sp.]